MGTVMTLEEADRRYYLHPTSPIKEHYHQGPKLILDRGEGVYVYDTQGNRYIDALSSLWNVNVGHGRKELAEAAMNQMSRLAFSHSFNNFSHEPVIRLAEKLASLTPGDLNVSFFASGGSEANDTAFKLVRHYFKLKGEPNRYKIIARNRAYHGIAMGATSATGIPSFREMGGPLAEGFIHAPAPHCYHCELNLTYPECQLACAAQSIRELIEKEGPDTIAAIIAEPIQGAGGVIVPPNGYFREVRRICDEYGILMIADEVITGFGRTGKWFGMLHEGVQADMMSFAKGVTSGYVPLGGVAISDRMNEELVRLSSKVLPHGYTYSGHPTSCAVALKNIEIIERENLVDNAAKMGQLLQQRLQELKDSSPIVGNVMSRGLLASVELVQDRSSKKGFDPAAGLAAKVADAALQKGLITRAISILGSEIIAMAPPLIINEGQIEQVTAILADAIDEVAKQI
jgi:putrescine aminotransferase